MSVTKEMPHETTDNPIVLKDGIEHINIDMRARTELGRMLSSLYYAPFNHPLFGPFNSMEAFMAWIRSVNPSNSIRELSGMEARWANKAAKGPFLEDFDAIVEEANFYKISQNSEMRRLMLESTLPFDHYYIYQTTNKETEDLMSGLFIRPASSPTVTGYFEHVRELLKTGRHPATPNYGHLLKRL
jgi:hypothetical protein